MFHKASIMFLFTRKGLPHPKMPILKAMFNKTHWKTVRIKGELYQDSKGSTTTN